MKKTLQECKEIVAREHGYNNFEDALWGDNSNDAEIIIDLANKMYYEQSECESLKAENERLKSEIAKSVCMIKSEPDGIVRETMINNLLIDL
jgi:hypothetical protein